MKRISAPKVIGGAFGAGLLLVAMPAAAQSEARLDRIERQLGALQRAVFPGGDERFFEPEITPETRPSGAINSPGVSSSALTDVLARLDAIESQLARLTAATEVNENALMSLEQRIARLEAQGVDTTPVLTMTPSPSPSPSGVIPVPPSTTPTPAPAPTPTPQPTPSAERIAAVQAIVKPETGDAGEDEYTYGFRLWDAGFYPEAQQQLAMYVERYPSHRLNSRGRNLLGRAFLDAGDAEGASSHFLENYLNDPSGDRAGDSLLYLAEAQLALGVNDRACIALAEFGETYPALAIGRLQNMYDGLRGRVTCG